MKATLAVAILSSTLATAQNGGGGVAYKKMSKLRGDPIVQNMQKVKKAAVEKNKMMAEEQTFDFEGVSLSMTAGEVDKDFCASASPVSLAGYMNGKLFLFLDTIDRCLMGGIC